MDSKRRADSAPQAGSTHGTGCGGEHAMGPWGGEKVRRGLMLVLDVGLAVCSLRMAYWLRFDGEVPAHYLAALPRAVALVAACRLAASVAASLDRWSFRLAGLSDALRVASAAVAGSVCIAALAPSVVPGGVPRSVLIFEFFLSASLLGGLRFGPRVALRWARRLQPRPIAERTLIIGDGGEAELLARDLERCPDPHHLPVGLVASERHAKGGRVAGLAVLGGVADLPELIRRHRIGTVLLAERCSGERVRHIIETCATSRVRFKIVAASYVPPRSVSAAMLDDVSPEGPPAARPPVAFDEAELQPARGGPARARHRRGRVDRRRDLPAARALRRPPARHGRHERERAATCARRRLAGELPGGRRPRRGRRRPRGRARIAAARRALPPAGRLPRRRAQARAAHGGRAGRGGEEQRLRHAARRPHGRRVRRRALRPHLHRQGGEPDAR